MTHLESVDLDVELEQLPLEQINRLGLGLPLNLDSGSSLVEQVDRRVGQSSLGEVLKSGNKSKLRSGHVGSGLGAERDAHLLGELGSEDEGSVEDADSVVDRVLFADASEDGDRLRHGRLRHQHLSEPSLERRVLLDTFAELQEERSAVSRWTLDSVKA